MKKHSITTFQRTLAYVLLGSHVLTSCYSNKEIVYQQPLCVEQQLPISQQRDPVVNAPSASSYASAAKSSQENAIASTHRNSESAQASIGKQNPSPPQHQPFTPSKTQALALLPNAKRQRTDVAPSPVDMVFTNHQHCRIQFTDNTLSLARVADIHRRTFQLPVHKQEPNLRIEDLITRGSLWQQAHISVVFPEKDSHRKGYVLIAYMGLRGGAKIYCSRCRLTFWAEPAPWYVPGGAHSRDLSQTPCPICRTNVRERENREREERERREREERERREREYRERQERERRERENREREERERREREERERREREERERREREDRERREREYRERQERERRERENRGCWKGVKSAAKAVWNGIKAAAQSTWNGIKAAGNAVWSGVKAAAQSTWNGIKAAGKAIWTGVKATGKAIWTGIKETGKFIWKHKWKFLIGAAIVGGIALLCAAPGALGACFSGKMGAVMAGEFGAKAFWGAFCLQSGIGSIAFSLINGAQEANRNRNNTREDSARTNTNSASSSSGRTTNNNASSSSGNNTNNASSGSGNNASSSSGTHPAPPKAEPSSTGNTAPPTAEGPQASASQAGNETGDKADNPSAAAEEPTAASSSQGPAPTPTSAAPEDTTPPTPEEPSGFKKKMEDFLNKVKQGFTNLKNKMGFNGPAGTPDNQPGDNPPAGDPNPTNAPNSGSNNPPKASVTPAQLTQAAADVLEEVIYVSDRADYFKKKREDDDGRFIPKEDLPKDAKCNIGVYSVFERLTGNTSLTGKTANAIVDHFADSPDWEEIPMDQAQQLANEGNIVMVGWKNPLASPRNTHSGHVAVVVPGEMQESGKDSWNCKVPVTFDVGKGVRQSRDKLTFGFGQSKKAGSKFYIYKGRIKK